MSVTPSKDSNSQFTPKELPTRTKDHSGITQTIFSHISNLHSLLNNWDVLVTKGKKICRLISSIKLHEFQDDYYPRDVQDYMETLVEVVDGLEHIEKGVEELHIKLGSLAKLPPFDTPVMQTWTAKQTSQCVSDINDLIAIETRLKKTVLENIAHCRDEHLIIMYASAWEYNLYFDSGNFLDLFIEFGINV